MTRIEGRTEFQRTPAEMFDFLADPRHEPEYNPLIVHAEKLTAGPISPGHDSASAPSGSDGPVR
jgi:hypothetical protein